MQILQRCLGTLDHMLSGQDTVSAQSPSVLQDGGKSPRTVATDHLLPALSPLRPLTGARSPGRSGCTCARDPWPLYLVESDCIQGKGALGVQATAVLRSGEEEQKKGK